MNVYSTRFHTLSALIRKLHDEYVFEKHIPPEWEKQLHNLNYRATLLKFTLGFASWGFLFNMLTVFFLYLDKIIIARLIFGGCCMCMLFSIFIFLQEIRLSTKALKFHLTDMKSMSEDLK